MFKSNSFQSLGVVSDWGGFITHARKKRKSEGQNAVEILKWEKCLLVSQWRSRIIGVMQINLIQVKKN